MKQTESVNVVKNDRFDAATGRLIVHVDDESRLKNLKPENCRVVLPTDEELKAESAGTDRMKAELRRRHELLLRKCKQEGKTVKEMVKESTRENLFVTRASK